jgi:glycosyltransferase involved in cell wall biosynthesis
MEVEYLPSVRRLPTGDRVPPTSDLVFVGRLHTNKGPDLLLEALHLAAGWGIRPTTDIYGSGDMESSLRRRIAEFGLSATVRLHGPIEATPLAAALRSARLLVIPSRIDSTPLVLGEAIQTQTPVLVTDVGDTGRLVRLFNLGDVVEPNSPDALARGIMESLQRPDGVSRDWTQASALMSPEAAVDRFLVELRREPRPAARRRA